MNATSVAHTIAAPDAAHAPSSAHRKFIDLQERLLRHYGVEATSRYMQLARPAMRAHVLEAGRGEPLVILHGGDGQGVDWAPLMSVLQGDLRLYAVDRPGFGLSDPFDYRRVDLRRHAADFVISVLDALGLESAAIAGGSMGGFFGLCATLARPERVRSLVLVGMPVGIAKPIPLALRLICGVPGMSRVFTALLGDESTRNRKRQYEKMFRVDPAGVPELYFETQVAGVTLPGAQDTWAVLLRRVAGLRGMKPEVMVADELPRLETPTLFVWGENDMIPAAIGKAASERMPSARFVLLPGIGHFPFLEAPLRTATLILDFLGAAAPRASGA